MNDLSIISELEALLRDRSPEISLQILSVHFEKHIAFSTSCGLEDQAITHLIFNQNLPLEIFTLDTGRMFEETYNTWNRTLEKYTQPIKAYYRDADALKDFVTEKGPNSFYESVENRMQCCYIRKVEPLKKALNGKKVWITGLRSDQSKDRKSSSKLEWDPVNKIIKFHPILNWTSHLTSVKQYHYAQNTYREKEAL